MKTTLLRWSVSLVLGESAVALAVQSRHVPLVALGVLEAVGAVLLLPRRTRVVGAALLGLSLVAGTVLHVISGEVPSLAFLVYGAAIAVAASTERGAA